MNQTSKKSRFSFVTTAILVVFGVVLTVILIVNIAGRIYIERRIKSYLANDPQNYERFMDYIYSPINAPDEWFEPLPVSEETKKKAERYKDLIRRYDMSDLQKKIDPRFQGQFEQLTPDKLIAMRQAIEGEAGAIAVTRELIDAPDYDLGLFAPSLNMFVSPNLRPITKYILTFASLEALEGKWSEAFDCALIVSRVAKRRPGNSYVVHIGGVAIQSNAQLCLAHLARQCPDASLLRDVRLKMLQMQPYVLPDVLDRALELDMIAKVKMYQQAGYEKDLTPGKPLIYYSRQVTMVKEKWALHQRENSQIILPSKWFYYGRIVGLGDSVDRLRFLLESGALYEYERTREKIAIAEFNIVSAYLAVRISELETGTRPETPEALLQGYLETIPGDPFTGQSMLWDATQKNFYSAGPNKTDDGNQIRYDVSNGINSSGDLFLMGA